jgi:hypothetical protein
MLLWLVLLLPVAVLRRRVAALLPQAVALLRRAALRPRLARAVLSRPSP